MRFLLLSILLALVAVTAPHAEDAKIRKFALNIPREHLDAALSDLARVTGLQIARLSDEGSLLDDVGPLQGEFDAESALRVLLEGTGLRYEFVDARLVKVYSAHSSAAPGNQPRLAQATSGQDQGGAGSVDKRNDPSPRKDSAPIDELQEITVVARKRTENVQNVPISVSVLSGSQLQEHQIQRVEDLAATVPNMTVDGNGNILGAIGLRGVVEETRNIGFDSGLGVYVDGVLATRPAENNQELPDVASVEVLRGPQGTLFGRNTTAGAINILTRQPADFFTADVQAGVGNLDSRNANVFVSGPLLDGVLTGKISGYENYDRGYVYNETLNKWVDGTNHAGTRAGLRWTPDSDVEVLMSGYYTQQLDSRLFGQLMNNNTGALAGQPGIFANPDLVQQDTPSYQNIYSAGGSVHVDWKLPGGFAFTSISGYGSMQDRFQDDDDARPLTFAASTYQDGTDQFTQELRIASPSSGAFDYLAGIFYLHQSSQSHRETLVNAGYAGYITDISALTTDAYAGFVSGNFRPTAAIEISGGLRYNRETKAVDFFQRDTSVVGLPGVDEDLQRDDAATSGNISITYKFNPSVRAYASVARGFKSGGFNADTVASANIGFAPEFVWSYEAGLKSEPFDDRAHFNLALFQSNFTDLQVTQLLTNSQQLTNAGAAKIRGGEAEFIAQPVSGLDVNASAGYLDPHYVRFDNCGFALNCAGNVLPFDPRWTLNTGVGYREGLSDAAALLYRIDWSYKSQTYSEPTNNPMGLARGYSLLNGRLALSGANGRYEIGLWAKNLLDKRYLENTFYLAPYQQWKESWAPPRTYGLDVKLHY